MRKKVISLILTALLLISTTVFAATITINNKCDEDYVLKFLDGNNVVEVEQLVKAGESKKVTIKGGESHLEVYDTNGLLLWTGSGKIAPDNHKAEVNFCDN